MILIETLVALNKATDTHEDRIGSLKYLKDFFNLTLKFEEKRSGINYESLELPKKVTELAIIYTQLRSGDISLEQSHKLIDEMSLTGLEQYGLKNEGHKLYSTVDEIIEKRGPVECARYKMGRLHLISTRKLQNLRGVKSISIKPFQQKPATQLEVFTYFLESIFHIPKDVSEEIRKLAGPCIQIKD